MAAIERARSADGVLVLMDLGSALMSAEMAVEMIDPDGGRVVLCEAPLVEGAVAAAPLARAGRGARRGRRRGARRRCGMKAAQLGAEGGAPPRAERAGGEAAGGGPEHELRLTIEPASGLHARPAARLVAAMGGGSTPSVTIENLTRGTGPAGGRQPRPASSCSAARQGDEVLVRASGPEAEAALDAIARAGRGELRRSAGAGAGTAARAVRPRRRRPPAPRARAAGGGAATDQAGGAGRRRRARRKAAPAGRPLPATA